MTIRANHYDAAFEEFIRQGRIPYVAVDESRRAQWGGASLKSLDFVVYSPELGNLLVDVKGRRCPGPGEPGRRWENWATADDLESMERWQAAFGGGFRALLVFAYWLPAERTWSDLPVMSTFRGRDYAFFGVWADDYRGAMRVRSPRWETVWLPSGGFRQLRFPLRSLATTAS